MKTKIKQTLVTIIALIFVLCTLSACKHNLNSLKEQVESPNSALVQQVESPNPALVQNIMNNIEKWEYVSDSYTQRYTYDNVESDGYCLYTKGEQGVYYFGAQYTIKSGNLLIPHERIFIATDTQFEYMISINDSVNRELLQDYKLLNFQVYTKGNDRKECIETLVIEGLKAEEEYFKEINLNTTSDIILTEEQNKLYNNMYFAILELEQYDPRISGNRTKMPLAKIEYYNLGNGSCEMLLYHGYTIGNSGSFYVGGYLVNENGYKKLGYDDEEKLKNTSGTKKLDWNIDWTTEKKEYMLKKSISIN